MDIKEKQNEKEISKYKYDKYGYRIEDFNRYTPNRDYIKVENENKLVQKLKELENRLDKYEYADEIPLFLYNMKTSSSSSSFNNLE